MAINARRIIILGASGFIGNNLFNKFTASKITTLGFSSKELNLLSAKEMWIKLADVTPCDILVVAAAITRLRENTPDSMIKNIRMAESVADFIVGHPVGHVIYLSTIDVYGVDIAKGAKITEKTELCPTDYYAISKLAGEFLLRKACGYRKIPLAILRLCGIYGQGDGDKSTIGSIASQAFRTKKITIYGDGKNLRDYIHVNDLYALMQRVIDKKKLNITVNVATGRSYSICAIARIITSSLPEGVAIEFKAQPLQNSNTRVRDLLFDCSYFQKSFPGLELGDLKDRIPVYLKEIRQRTE